MKKANKISTQNKNIYLQIMVTQLTVRPASLANQELQYQKMQIIGFLPKITS